LFLGKQSNLAWSNKLADQPGLAR